MELLASQFTLFANDKALLHKTPLGHPESPDRFSASLSFLHKYPLRKGRAALEEELHLVHTPEYVALAKNECLSGQSELSTGDVFISKGSFEAALYSAGSALSAVDYVFEEGHRAFSLMRPPGHHACAGRGMGFCLFNNAALAARYAQKKYGLKRIAILDFDLHHGNGTEEIFFDDPSILYASSHESPLYPGTGLSSTGHILNFPIPGGIGSREKVLDVYEKTLPPLCDDFKPELMIISAGFDAHKLDPLGHLDLETEDFFRLTKAIVKIAETNCQGRIVSLLEGGYHIRALRESIDVHIQALLISHKQK
jgi:acetoin utilization deacetylase AcuC-like enzyme